MKVKSKVHVFICLQVPDTVPGIGGSKLESISVFHHSLNGHRSSGSEPGWLVGLEVAEYEPCLPEWFMKKRRVGYQIQGDEKLDREQLNPLGVCSGYEED